MDHRLQLYLVVDLFKTTRRVMQCGECLGICDYYEVFPEEKAKKDIEEAQKRQQEAAAQAKKKAEEEAERVRVEEQEAKRRADDRKKLEAEVEDELAQLKRKLGK